MTYLLLCRNRFISSVFRADLMYKRRAWFAIWRNDAVQAFSLKTKSSQFLYIHHYNLSTWFFSNDLLYTILLKRQHTKNVGDGLQESFEAYKQSSRGVCTSYVLKIENINSNKFSNILSLISLWININETNGFKL